MKKIVLYILSAVIFSNCKQPNKLIVNIDSNYRGWVYLIPAKVEMKDAHEINSNSSGIVYLSDSLYSKSNEVNVVVTINDSLYPPRPIKIYDISFYPSNSSYKIMYKKFYFPLTNTDNAEKDDTLYTYKQGRYNTNYVNQFQYYYLTGVIDSNIIKKW